MLTRTRAFAIETTIFPRSRSAFSWAVLAAEAAAAKCEGPEAAAGLDRLAMLSDDLVAAAVLLEPVADDALGVLDDAQPVIQVGVLGEHGEGIGHVQPLAVLDVLGGVFEK